MNEELKVIISAEVGKLKNAVATAKKSIGDFAKDAKAKIDKFGEDFSAIGDKAKAGLAIVGGAVAAAGAALLSLTSSTQEYRTAQAKLNTAFETAGAKAGTAKNTYNDLYRVLGDGDVAVEAAGHLAKLTTEEKALSEWTTICEGVYATFGDSIPIEGLTEAANETAKTGALTGSLADALNWAGVNEEAFQKQLDACNTEAEREALIRETLNGLYNDAAANYEENNASLLAYNEAQAKMAEASARVGEALQPVMTALTTLGADVLTALAPYIEQFAAEYLPKITEALAGVGEKIGAVIGWIADNWELISTIGTIILGTVAALAALSAAVTVVSTVLAIVTSPMTLVVLGITAIVAAIVLCIKYWDEIKAAVKNAVEAIKNWLQGSKLGQIVLNIFGAVVENIKSRLNQAKEIAIAIFEYIVNDIKAKLELAKQIVTNIIGIIKGIFTGDFALVKESVANILTAITNYFQSKLSNAKTTALNIFNSIKDGITERINNTKTAIFDSLGLIVTNFSTKFTQAKTAVLNIFNSIKQGIADKLSAAKDAISSSIDKMKGLFNFSWSLPKPKFPKFSVSGGEAPWGFMGQGSLPKISISWNAMGGVFENPTVRHFGNSLQGLAENGAEAIVPLENNLGWLDKLAGMLSDRMGGSGQPIVLTIDGKVFAQTSIDSINQLTRQTGTLGINIV